MKTNNGKQLHQFTVQKSFQERLAREKLLSLQLKISSELVSIHKLESQPPGEQKEKSNWDDARYRNNVQ